MVIIIRAILGVFVGAVCGAIIAALISVLITLFEGDTSSGMSLGGIGTVTHPLHFAVVLGAVAGLIAGVLIGLAIGLTNSGILLGGGIGIVISGLIIALLLSINEVLDKDLVLMLLTGAAIGFVTAFLFRMLLNMSKSLS